MSLEYRKSLTYLIDLKEEFKPERDAMARRWRKLRRDNPAMARLLFKAYRSAIKETVAKMPGELFGH